MQNQNGLFDRSTVGRVIEPVPVMIERGRLQFFAKVLGERDPIHSDVRAARAAGYPDIVAPASFFMVSDATANELRKRTGVPIPAEIVKCDYRYLLHGEERYFYASPIFAGDEVQIETRILDFYDKKGGAMEFVTFESRITHEARGELASGQRTLLHRLPQKKG